MNAGEEVGRYAYVGTELGVFEHAVRWKAYLGELLAPFLRGAVLEVGAGIGSTTPFLINEAVEHWKCLEPDPGLEAETARRISDGRLPALCTSSCETVRDLPEVEHFDAITYIDVLEHIEDDRAELRDAVEHLHPGGYLAVLSPAWPWLFSPFDAAVGHYRRYTRASLDALRPPGSHTVLSHYVDSVGLVASAGNRLLLRNAEPTDAQVQLWDTRLVPLSRRLDPLLRHRVGKSVLLVWKKVSP